MRHCPYLRKRSDKEFVCIAMNTVVNPFLAPCLSNYEECPMFIRAETRREKEEKREERVEKEEVRREEAVIEILERGLEDRIRELEEAIRSLNDLWRAYSDAAKKVIRGWNSYKRVLERRLSSLDRELKGFELTLNELEVRKELGMIDDTVYQKTFNEIQLAIEKTRTEAEKIQGAIKHIEELLEEHIKRIGPLLVEITPESIKESLTKLEDMYKEGKIDEKTYKKLRKELEEYIRML
ncbi:MAG: hypothetical protein DRJ66_02415 [Thermoprotei archaeon]|nr:MAG: hypothetical protein DRJ66_02415 [Thermoprotei archaeon]RLF18461.1 MAG: hypothetical protein DRZ82_08150 [Thermoprotei archaeon]